MSIVNSGEFFVQEFVVRHEIRLEIGIHIGFRLHVLQHIPNIGSSFILIGNALNAISKGIQQEYWVIPIFLGEVVADLPHGSSHMEHELPVCNVVLIKCALIPV